MNVHVKCPTPIKTVLDHHRKGVLLAFALLLLIACSGEPSEADIKKAYDVKFAQVKQSAAGSILHLQLHSVKKLGCTKATGNAGYNCDMEVDVESIRGREKNAVKVRLVKADAGWVLIEEQR